MVEPMLSDRGMRSHYDVGSELIVVDQRGAGASDPALECRDAMEVAALTPEPDDADAMVDAVSDCRERLVADDVDLDGSNHVANADDVEMVRRALGQDRIDVEGTSYGSLLALLVAERHPEGIRSLVLTSPGDPSRNFLEGVAPDFGQALDRLSNACAWPAPDGAAGLRGRVGVAGISCAAGGLVRVSQRSCWPVMRCLLAMVGVRLSGRAPARGNRSADAWQRWWNAGTSHPMGIPPVVP